MNSLKKILVAMGLKGTAKWVRDFYLLLVNYFQDAVNYYKYSYVFRMDNFNKIEADIIMAYHSIEKGFLHEDIKFKFSENKVESIINNLKKLENKSLLKNNSQILAAINVLIQYYEFHLQNGINIESFFPKEKYNFYLSLKDQNFQANHRIDKIRFYQDISCEFKKFSNSRKSIRDFTGELIEEEKLKNVIALANNSPSVCNRQSCITYVVSDKEKIQNILKIQGGFSGYDKNVNQLLILVSNKNHFFSIGERNQMYIDGGIYLMNLLYSLHFYKIAACPANWGKCVNDDKKIRKYVNIPMNEQIICMIPIGLATQEVVYAHSERRRVDETLRFI